MMRARSNLPSNLSLKVTIDPPRIAVGQRTTLRIDVLAPNYMTSPPELPDFQIETQ